MSTPLRIGVDVGGTFTDLVYTDAQGVLRAVKVPSTPPDFDRGVVEAVRVALRASAPQDVAIVHGSTVATNALLERKGERVAFITTEGFRDLLLIGRQNRPELYALRIERPKPVVGEDCFFTVRERVAATGEVVTPLTDAEIGRVVAEVRGANLRHAAVCLLFSFVNADHERRVGRALEAAGITVSLSSDVLPEFREYERASTTAINAALRPIVETYLTTLAESLRTVGGGATRVELSIMLSAGGTTSPGEASRQAARMVLSGPAGGVQGAARIARLAGALNVITYDMGGTSTDVAAILEGAPQWTTTSTVDGLPLGLSMYDIVTVGAGGGSIAHLDPGGALRVGPRSAGSRPGPACYGRGGTEPTVTDANVVLGRIPADAFLGGAVRIDRSLAERAIAALAGAMAKSVVDAALGILEVAEANMASALRAVTTRRGHDPRQYALLSFGGAGGLHAARLAEQLEMSDVVVPPFAGVLSALGMVTAPASAEVSRSVIQHRTLTDERLAAELAGLRSVAERRLPTAETYELACDCRFAGQSHELRVPILAPTLAAVSDAFHSAYRRLYSRLPTGRAVQIVTLRCRALGAEPACRLPELMPDATALRQAPLHNGPARVASRAQLLGLGVLEGPALLLDPEATTFIPPGWAARTSAHGIVRLARLA